MNQLDLHGRHGVITGGATGLGFAIAQRMLASGASVTLWDRDPQALERACKSLGGGARGVLVDVADYSQVEAALAQTLQATSQIDMLVNSAVITGPNTTLWDYPVLEWERVMQVNLNGVFHVCKAVVPVMRSQDYGRIVNIASVAGKEGNPNASAYSASKAAVIGLTKSLGKELAQTGIRVNCVTPAAVQTPIFDQMKPEHIAYMLGKIPMGRFGTTEEVASMVCWLCTQECSFSTGAVFDLSGGRSTY
jgi:3-oxoacyl-[acyl-carrier protein] reductase